MTADPCPVSHGGSAVGGEAVDGGLPVGPRWARAAPAGSDQISCSPISRHGGRYRCIGDYFEVSDVSTDGDRFTGTRPAQRRGGGR